MRQTATALGHFVTATGQTYDRLLATAFLDGAQHGASDAGVETPRIAEPTRNAIFARLRNFYHPSLVKMHGELIGVVRNAGTAADIDKWFSANRYRLDMALTGLLWSASEAGYALAAVDDNGRPLPLYWLTERAANPCFMCEGFESGNPYYGYHSLPALPGDGTSVCGANCLCAISLEPA